MQLKIIAILILLTSICFTSNINAQNIKFYKESPATGIRTIDFDQDSILYLAIKADSSLLEFDMFMFSTTLSRRNGKRKWFIVNNLMPKTFLSKLKEDGYYHFVAFRDLGNGLSYSEIGLTTEDFRYGKIQMNTSLAGKESLTNLNNDQNRMKNQQRIITTNHGFVQYEADVIDFSLPITVEKFSQSTKIRTKKIIKSSLLIGALTAVIVSPALIVIAIL
ncbi:MAG: hypothetical protein C0599_09330 [Salinivirgaceae bacterium]|nr:MAG: hypothetical protein C0599_09330 [Salinivirgaceae bacterium]